MKKRFLSIALLVSGYSLNAQTNPAILSWLQNTTNVMGRHYVSGNSTAIQEQDDCITRRRRYYLLYE